MSVIPGWLNNYWPQAYQSLVAKETWSYNNQGQVSWQPLYQQLADALNAWQSYDRRGEIQAFMLGTYGYLVTGIVYGTDTSLKPQMDGYSIYSAGDYLPFIITQPVDYYNDLAPSGTPPAYTSVKMTASVKQVTDSMPGQPNSDAARAKAVSGATQPALQDHMYIQLFQTLPIQGTAGKSAMANIYFNDLHWKAVYQNLNVGGLPLPPGV